MGRGWARARGVEMGLGKAGGHDPGLDGGGEGQEGVAPVLASLPAVSQQTLEDIGGPGRPEHRPLQQSVFEDATVDFVGSQPLLHPLLHAVTFRESHRLGPRVETVIYKIDFVLREQKARHGISAQLCGTQLPAASGNGAGLESHRSV